MSKATPYYWREAAPYESRGEIRYEPGNPATAEERIALRETIERHHIEELCRAEWATLCNGRLTLVAERTEVFPLYIAKKADGSRWLYMPQSPEPKAHFIRLGENIEEHEYIIAKRYDTKEGGAR